VADGYKPRIVEQVIRTRSARAGAVVIEGPKACGKTLTASQFANTIYRFDADANARTTAQTVPSLLFEATPPILFDEWQLVPSIWNQVKVAADEPTTPPGQFLLAGSATPADDVQLHTGAGRMSWVRMRPMSLLETGHSTGSVSLRDLFDGQLTPAVNNAMTVTALVDRIVIGGWPSLLGATVPEAQQWLQDYLQAVCEVDVPRLGTGRNPAAVRRLLEALGRNVGTSTPVTKLAADVGGASGPARYDTIAAYLTALERLMLVEDVPAWSPHMRSKARLRTAETRYLVDPSVGVAALRQGPAQLLNDLNATGLHFEALVMRDVRIYSQPMGGTLSSWRDSNGREVDIIVTLGDGRWGAFEVKLNPNEADAAAASLLNFAAAVDTSKVGEPSVLGVLTTTGPAHRRPDGVVVVPVTTLGP
jgi:predicted AAA+ superfamily ATPase